MKKKRTPETQLQYELGTCSKQNDLKKAISLYNSALSQNLRLSHHHFNSILHLCSSPESLSSPNKSFALENGFRVFEHMQSNKIPPTEATITQVARLAAAKNDPDYAFELIKCARDKGVSPRLRTYGPALLKYCENLRIEEAYGVEEHMKGNGVKLEEGELSALLRVSAEVGREEKVYEYLSKLRGVVRGVSEETAGVVEKWFQGAKAAEVGVEAWDVGKVREVRERCGGGWHGMGWLGKGPWEVKRVKIGYNGVCCGCGERLVCVDIDCGETERFAQSIAGLAMEREIKSDFKSFMEWIDSHSGYEAIVDGANIGLYQQNFSEGGFSIAQLEAVVMELYTRNKRWPLVVLHKKRLRAFQENPSSQKLLEEWLSQGILYATPSGSNDDWYWLYAAVKMKCLLVTNDEMRDHIFELLGSSFFLQWKERHQVHYTFGKGVPNLKMPPTYSILIQESENGSWHIPIASENTDELSRSWLCITRPSSFSNSSNSGESMHITSKNCSNGGHHSSGNGVASLTGKRKERDPSPSRLD
ncbi:proteinaceous RNase P 2-like [Chenopodium quinoa]|uniref:ribonuclease P n=1 Tax=Chenopodium quinoa TaxID=63459 RepID=A0A803LD46_CHEQI|nr:proteinaceous RNase P 2-like [Chenopodium quinoa]